MAYNIKNSGWRGIDSNMFSGSFLYLIAAISVLVLYFWHNSRHLNKLAAKIPGPQALPIIGNVLLFKNIKNSNVVHLMTKLVETYGGTSRIWLGPNLYVLISKPEDIEICLNSSKLVEKNEMYSFMDDILGQGLLNSSGDIWKKHRRIISPTFHISVLNQFVEIFDRQTMTLVKRLEKTMFRNINIFPYLRDCTLDFIAETALETNINAQGETVLDATSAAEKMMALTYDRMFKVWLHPNRIFYMTQNGQEYLKLRSCVRNVTDSMINSYKSEISKRVAQEKCELATSKRKSFVRLLVDLNENGDNFSDQELKDEILTIIITGYETTAATMSFLMVMLGIHQDVQEKVYEEVRRTEERVNGGSLTIDDIQDFHYTDRVIKETLRMWPVGPMIFRKATADVKLVSCTVPKGASVGVIFMSTHRDPSIWKNPQDFNPDNFLPENMEKRHPYSFNPFSAGARNCIGKRYAEISMRVMIYHILRHYRVHTVKKMSDIGVTAEITLKMADGFSVRLEPRNPPPAKARRKN